MLVSMDIFEVSIGAAAGAVVVVSVVTEVLSEDELLEPELWQATAKKPRPNARTLTFNTFFIFKSF